MKKDLTMILQSDILKKYGWTKKMINELLPAPTYKYNPNCTYTPYKLWPEHLVLEVMESEGYRIAREKVERRRSGAHKAAEKRAEQQTQERADMEKRWAEEEKTLREKFEPAFSNITVKILPTTTIEKLAIQNKKNFERNKANYYGYTNNFCPCEASESAIDRWAVNYIRHNLTQYDKKLEELEGTGSYTIYRDYKRAVLEKIAEVYPTYKAECERQILETY